MVIFTSPVNVGIWTCTLIVSNDDSIYKAIRNKILKDNAESENPKEYYDTRKYVWTGKKESDKPNGDE